MRHSEMCFHLYRQKLKLDDVEQAFSYFVAGLPPMKLEMLAAIMCVSKYMLDIFFFFNFYHRVCFESFIEAAYQ